MGGWVSGASRDNSAIFELHIPDFAWKFVLIVSTSFEQNANLQKMRKNIKSTKYKSTKKSLDTALRSNLLHLFVLSSILKDTRFFDFMASLNIILQFPKNRMHLFLQYL